MARARAGRDAGLGLNVEAVARETAFAPDFGESLGSAAGPAAIRARRQAARERFERLGFPTAGLEEWRYTGVGAITEVPWSSAADGGEAGIRISAPAAGATVRRLSDVLPDEATQNGSGVSADLGNLAPFDRNAFTALNTALFRIGRIVDIAPGAVLTEPIVIHLEPPASDGPSAPFAWHPRVLIRCGAASQATVIQEWRGRGASFTNAVTEVALADGAILAHYDVQRQSRSAFHVHTIAARQERASRFVSHNVALGSALARTEIGVRLAGEGAECELNGLFVGNGTQHLDNHTVIDHVSPHCTSRELYKGILDGSARGVFHGKIIVRPDAQKTDAIQTNKNLLLSNSALVNSTPALEIFADDVKCKHGSTIGQLDPDALFYLRSRGISESDARALLTYAFAADLTARIRVTSLRSEVESALGLRLPGERTDSEAFS